MDEGLTGKCALYFVELSDGEHACTCRADWIGLLPGHIQERIHRAAYGIDKCLILLSQLFLRHLLSNAVPQQDLNALIRTGAHGKPYLSGYPRVQFNLSHTRNAIAIALSDRPVGVDIERIRSADRRIAQRYFCEKERAYLYGGQPEELDRRFFEIWTNKEAYIKYTGEGISLPLRSFDVLEPGIAPFMHSMTIRGYMLSVCGASVLEQSAVYTLSEEQALQAIAEYARQTHRREV